MNNELRKNMNAQVTIIEPEELDFMPAATMLRLLTKYQEGTKNYKRFKATVAELPELFLALEALDIEPGFTIDNAYISLSFAGDGPKLTAVWKLLRQHGYSTNARPKKGDTTFYSFWSREGYAELFMNFTSTLCKRVQIGTQMVEQPIYETQCGDMTAGLEIEAPKAAVVEVDDDLPF